MSRTGALQEWLNEFEGRGHADGFRDGCHGGERYLLVEENTRGGFWLTTWQDLESAADYHVNQEYASEWDADCYLVDLDTDDRYEPVGRRAMTWGASTRVDR